MYNLINLNKPDNKSTPKITPGWWMNEPYDAKHAFPENKPVENKSQEINDSHTELMRLQAAIKQVVTENKTVYIV